MVGRGCALPSSARCWPTHRRREQLGARLKELAAKDWRHPVTGLPLRFGFGTLERWYYLARDAQDPVAALRRRRRRDAGRIFQPLDSLVP